MVGGDNPDPATLTQPYRLGYELGARMGGYSGGHSGLR